MQLQELIKNALIDAGMVDYAVDAVEPELMRQSETMARMSASALNNDPALSFGLDTVALERITSPDIFFPLEQALLTEQGGAVLMENGE